MKFFIDNIWLLAIAVLSGGALLLPSLQRRGEKVSILQATQMINQGKTALLDVRASSDFSAGHVRDALNIPLKELASRMGELEKWKSKSVVAICYSGVTSAKATAMLRKAGFETVFSLEGGMDAWRVAGLPMLKKDAVKETA